MVDFGADDPFVQASKKLKEHYGIDVPVSAIRDATEKHGAAALESEKQGSELPDRPGVAVLIAEADGSMVPVVETAEPAKEGGEPIDRRKTREFGLAGSPALSGASARIGDADFWSDYGKCG